MSVTPATSRTKTTPRTPGRDPKTQQSSTNAIKSRYFITSPVTAEMPARAGRQQQESCKQATLPESRDASNSREVQDSSSFRHIFLLQFLFCELHVIAYDLFIYNEQSLKICTVTYIYIQAKQNTYEIISYGTLTDKSNMFFGPKNTHIVVGI